MNPYFQQPNATLTPDILVHRFRSQGQRHIHTQLYRQTICGVHSFLDTWKWVYHNLQLKQAVRCKLHFGKTCPLDQAVGFSSPKVHMNCAMTDVAPPPPKTFLVERFGHQRCRGITSRHGHVCAHKQSHDKFNSYEIMHHHIFKPVISNAWPPSLQSQDNQESTRYSLIHFWLSQFVIITNISSFFCFYIVDESFSSTLLPIEMVYKEYKRYKNWNRSRPEETPTNGITENEMGSLTEWQQIHD